MNQAPLNLANFKLPTVPGASLSGSATAPLSLSQFSTTPAAPAPAPAAPTDQANSDTTGIFQKVQSAFQKLSPLAASMMSGVAGPIANPVTAKGADAVTGSEQNLGSDIGATIDEHLPGVQDAQAKSVAAKNQSLALFSQLIAKQQQMKAAGKDTTNLDNVIADEAKTLGVGDLGDIVPAAANKTKEQILGDAGGTLLDALSGGDYSGTGGTPSAVAAVADSASEGGSTLSKVAKGALEGVKIGAPLGAAQGLVHGAQDNEDAGGLAKSTLEGGATGAVGGGVAGGVAGGISAAGAAKANQSAQDLEDIGSTISPKMTAAETRSAIADGRVTRAPDSGLKVSLFGQQPDIVAQADEVKQAATTIQREIPGAAKMNDVQLYTALDGSVEQKAQSLEGEMQKVPVKMPTVGKINDSWSALKTTQEAEPEFDNFPGSAKSQSKFENYLKELNVTEQNTGTGKMQSTGSKTLDDIWNVRKDYDSSIPANVKNATEQSAPTLQWQKTMWLQNRAILNDAIHDTVSGLGSQSQQAFADMSDMYMAQQNLLTKAKIGAGTDGLLTKYLPKSKGGWLGVLGVGGGAYLAAKKLGLL